jgi:hypothetical protein
MTTVWHVLSLPVRAFVWMADVAMAAFRIGILLWLMVMGAIVLVIVGTRVNARLHAWRHVLEVAQATPTPFEMAGPEGSVDVRHGAQHDAQHGAQHGAQHDAQHDAFILAATAAPAPFSGGW